MIGWIAVLGPFLREVFRAPLEGIGPLDRWRDRRRQKGIPVRTCSLCGHEMTLKTCGYARVNEDMLCHADDHDCYHLWTVYKVRELPRCECDGPGEVTDRHRQHCPVAGLEGMVPVMARPEQLVACPTCHNPNVGVQWVGANVLYAEHSRPDTEEVCTTSGKGIGSHNLAKARNKR